MGRKVYRNTDICGSFFTNPVQQLTLDDALFSLTVRGRKALENSWAKVFADDFKD